jgi:hypothetical protein
MDAVLSSSSPQEPLRIVIVPWLAFGHLLPYLELSERLASRGHHVSYVSTPRNLARLPPLHPATAPRVDLVALPLPRVVQGLPDGAESSYDLPDEKREFHFQTFDSLAQPFAEFLAAACADEATRPHWIVFDAFHHLAAAVALDHKVPSNPVNLHAPIYIVYLIFSELAGAIRGQYVIRCHARHHAPYAAGAPRGRSGRCRCF